MSLPPAPPFPTAWWSFTPSNAIKEYRAIRKEKDRQKFYAAHEADFIINDAAKRQLDKLGAPKQLPKRKEVVAEIQSLISEKNECYNDYREKR